MLKCYFGTYKSDGGEGIYEATLDSNGVFSDKKLFAKALDSKYMIAEENYIFTVFGGEQESGVAVYSSSGELISKLEFEKSTSCYITKNGNYIYTANYHEGSISKLEFSSGQLKLLQHKVIMEKAGSHQVITFGDILFLPCLLMDRIYILDRDLNILSFIQLESGAAPRHGLISKDKKYLYLVGEYSDRLYKFDISSIDKSIDAANIKLINSISILATGSEKAKATAAVRMSKDGGILFISIRNIDSIAIVDISKDLPTVVQHYSSIGKHPRDILNIEDDKYLLVANKDTGNVVSFKMSENKIIKNCDEISAKGAVSICVI